MNNLHRELVVKTVKILTEESIYEDYAFEDRYAELIIIECLSKMSDHLDKQRVMKHFGMIE